MKRCRSKATCAECAGSHPAEQCTKGPEASRKCALCKGNHRAGSQSCAIERKKKERAEYARNHASTLYVCSQIAMPKVDTKPASAANTHPQPQPAADTWQIISRGRRGRPTQLSQAANDRSQLRLDTQQLGKRKERDFTSPSPRGRATRSQSQPASETRNSVISLDPEEEL
jgi:hypothetical protein